MRMLLIAFLLAAPLARAECRQRFELPLRADGDQLVDASGKKMFVLKGDVDFMAQTKAQAPLDCTGIFGFMHAVRLEISWRALEPLPATRNADGTWAHHVDARYLAGLDAAVARFTNVALAVIVSMKDERIEGSYLYDDRPAWLNAVRWTADGDCRFVRNVRERGVVIEPHEAYGGIWSFLAEHYASNPRVAAFDILGDRYGGDCAPDELYANAAHAIAEANGNVLVIDRSMTYRPVAIP